MKGPFRHKWVIQFRHHTMWKGWKSLMWLSDRTKEEAEKEAKDALFYFEGTTESRAVYSLF